MSTPDRHSPRVPYSQFSIGMAIRTSRLNAGRSMSSVVKATGMATSVISRIETGTRGLDFAEAVVLAKELGTTLEKLSELAHALEASGAANVAEQRKKLAIDLKNMRKNASESVL